MKTADYIIIGGGLTGAAIGLGLVRRNAGKVVLFDEHLPTQRLSRANFGLTWFMCKGANSPQYAKWCRTACMLWPDFAAELKAETGVDPELVWNGGAVHCIGEDQFRANADSITKISESCSKVGLDYPVRMLSRDEFADLVPKMTLGDNVSGAMYTPEQGHVNPLTFLGAMRKSFQQRGGEFQSGQHVQSIESKGGSVTVRTSGETFSAAKLIIAAGHGTPRLVAPLGMDLKIYPQRGQLMVTERRERVLPFPILAVRQTVDGTFMVGLSTEDTAHDIRVTPGAIRNQARNAIQLFPELAKVNWVRAWGAVRVMTPDGGPTYDTVPGHDNIYVMAMHSALSLAPMHVNKVAPWVMGGEKPEELSHFSNGRFHV